MPVRIIYPKQDMAKSMTVHCLQMGKNVLVTGDATGIQPWKKHRSRLGERGEGYVSVLVKGMEMPKCCDDCGFNYDNNCCTATSTGFYTYPAFESIIDTEEERLPDCPLIPVTTPHGNLIDREALMKVYGVYLGDKLIGALPTVNIDDVRDAPIIIGAEE